MLLQTIINNIFSGPPREKVELKNIAFEGGGVCGIAHCGAVMELEVRGLLQPITSFSGSSVGSIIATLLAMGCTGAFLKDKIANLNIFEVTDINPLGVFNIFSSCGISDGSKLVEFVATAIEELGYPRTVTFKELYDKTQRSLYITGTKLYKDFAETIYFSHQSHPNFSILDAIRTSTSYPILFQAPSHEGTLWTDGGYLDNLPLKAFASEADRTLATSFHRSTTAPVKDNCVGLLDFINGLRGGMMEMMERTEACVVAKHNIIIDVGNMHAMSIYITEEQKKVLYEAGIEATKKFAM